MWEETAKAGGGGILPPRPQPSTQGAWSFTLPWPLSSLCRQSSGSSGNGGQAVIANSPTASFVGMRLPYIPPEEFDLHLQSHCRDEHDNRSDFDSRPADVWATAMVYMALVTDRILWRSARPNQEDTRYLEYLHSRRGEDGYSPIESLGEVCCITFRAFNPEDKTLISVCRDDAMLSMQCCTLILGSVSQLRSCCNQNG